MKSQICAASQPSTEANSRSLDGPCALGGTKDSRINAIERHISPDIKLILEGI